jgi:hypothetical protein
MEIKRNVFGKNAGTSRAILAVPEAIIALPPSDNRSGLGRQ